MSSVTTATGPRLRILRAMRKVSHRYDALRLLGMTVSLATLVVVPLTGLARVDLATGKHFLLFEPTTFKRGLAGVILGIAAMYVVTFLSNVAAGRLFCGWGCPVGQISRFGEAVDIPGQSTRQRLIKQVAGALFSGVVVVAILAWWVDLRVLWQGPELARSITWSVLILGAGLAYFHGRGWRWEFCKSACPIGLYYSFVSPAHWYGVHFRNQHDTCIECDACDQVCPVDLRPRDLMAPVPARMGISIDEAPGRNHCLECGECVRACEWIIDLRGEEPVPLLLGYYKQPQRVERSQISEHKDRSQLRYAS